jgi:hypothetical protein
VFYDIASATTTLRWWSPGAQPADVYRGLIGLGITKGTYAAPFWRLDTSGAAGSQAACLRNDVGGTPETAPPAGPGGTRGTTGPIGLVDDPNPAIGAGVYYVVALDAPGAGSTNAIGCANPGVCSKAGWCVLGASAGAPCDVDADCPGGTCAGPRAFCTTSAGPGGGGGCGRHAVCSAGINAGRLCSSVTDCAGSACPLVTADVATAGSVCLNAAGLISPPLPGTVPSECPPAGSAARVVRQATPGGLCP